jgi:hypothetical protein
MLKCKVMTLAFVFFVCCGIANSKVLLVDDFEKDAIGKEPSNWETIDFVAGNSVITIEKDPTNPQNNVAKTMGIGLYIPKVAGR